MVCLAHMIDEPVVEHEEDVELEIPGRAIAYAAGDDILKLATKVTMEFQVFRAHRKRTLALDHRCLFCRAVEGDVAVEERDGSPELGACVQLVRKDDLVCEG